MLINLSNHPSVSWSKKQTNAAINQFGKIVDFPFPKVDPEFGLDEVQDLAQKIFSQVLEKYGNQEVKIHLMGELSLVYQLLLLF